MGALKGSREMFVAWCCVVPSSELTSNFKNHHSTASVVCCNERLNESYVQLPVIPTMHAFDLYTPCLSSPVVTIDGHILMAEVTSPEDLLMLPPTINPVRPVAKVYQDLQIFHLQNLPGARLVYLLWLASDQQLQLLTSIRVACK